MAEWILEPLNKKSAIETEYWTKGDVMIKVVTVFRWAEVIITSDDVPDIDLENEDGIDVYSLDYEVNPYNTTDGGTLLDFPDTLDDDEKTRIEEIYDSELNEGLENDGWTQEDYSLVFNGELKLTLVEE